MTTRMYPPRGVATTTTANGRSYSCAAESSINVPDQDATVLETNGWVRSSHSGSGATSARPTTDNFIGRAYLDETLGYTVRWNGIAWVNPMNGNVV